MYHGPICETTLVGVDAARMRELTHKYVEYRRSLAGSWDPVRTLNLTGDVLEAVRQVITPTAIHTGSSQDTERTAGRD